MADAPGSRARTAPLPQARADGLLSFVVGVAMGSNASTWVQTEGALQAAEMKRRELIARMPLRLVGEERPTLH